MLIVLTDKWNNFLHQENLHDQLIHNSEKMDLSRKIKINHTKER